mmetsp:Transcript_5178/g.16962  ORF Transcript_5178/g.16962 Transcript_5178/m.16962 type:complete len:202 (+) Transcript_5178:1193-1798(+)
MGLYGRGGPPRRRRRRPRRQSGPPRSHLRRVRLHPLRRPGQGQQVLVRRLRLPQLRRAQGLLRRQATPSRRRHLRRRRRPLRLRLRRRRPPRGPRWPRRRPPRRRLGGHKNTSQTGKTRVTPSITSHHIRSDRINHRRQKERTIRVQENRPPRQSRRPRRRRRKDKQTNKENPFFLSFFRKDTSVFANERTNERTTYPGVK